MPPHHSVNKKKKRKKEETEREKNRRTGTGEKKQEGKDIMSGFVCCLMLVKNIRIEEVHKNSKV